MPTELTFALFKYGLLVLLWLFVWLAVMSLKRDVTVLSSKTGRQSRRHRRRRRRKNREWAASSAAADLAAAANMSATAVPTDAEASTSAAAADFLGGVAATGSANSLDGASSAQQVEAGYSMGQSGLHSGLQPTMLVVIDGPFVGTSASLSNTTITIGRAPTNTLVLEDEFASSHHAQIYRNASGQWILEDLGSTNGTTLNNQTVQGLTVLYPHQQVRIGATTFELR